MGKAYIETALETARVLDSKKGEEIVLLDVTGMTIIADNFVIASGRSVTHVKSLCDELLQKMKAKGVTPLRVEGYREGRWIVADFGDVLVHIFHKDEREFYKLERLWTDKDNMTKFESLMTLN